MNEALTLTRTVIDGGYCVGCGACAAVADSPFEIFLNGYGKYQARIAGDGRDSSLDAPVLRVCPFAAEGPDEDRIAELLYPGVSRHERIGRHAATFAGHVVEGDLRERGSSGGMGTWLLLELLRTGRVDAVLHVRADRPDSNGRPLFGFAVSRARADVVGGAKSRYYPVEMSRVLRHVREVPARYAVTGIPCFVKAVRRLALADPIVNERVRFTIAIFCGHLKSTRFADSIAWQHGIPPGGLRSIDFRRKLSRRPANRYGVELLGVRGDGEAVHLVRPMEGHLEADWGHGFFKYEACDYCDDVVGETADVAVGDAWLPRFIADSAGTNVVIVRHPELLELIEQGRSSGRLRLEEISADDVAESQDSGFRHRRDGLAYRLRLKDRSGRWRPPKRVAPDARRVSSRYRTIFDLRMDISARSHTAFRRAAATGTFEPFALAMRRLVRDYEAIYRHRRSRHLVRIRYALRRLGR